MINGLLLASRHCEERSNPDAQQVSGLLRKLAMTGDIYSFIDVSSPVIARNEAIQKKTEN